MPNPLKKISDAIFSPQGVMGPPRFPTDTSQGRTYSRLRYGAFTISREQAGIPTPPPGSPVWAVLMETGHPGVTESLVLVSDGTSSVYMSNGDGVIGGHGYENVKQANADFIRLANRDRHHFQATEVYPIPEVGYTVFYARTDAGLLFCGAAQESLIQGRHPLSALFQAGHEAITQLHIIAVEKEGSNPKGSTSRDYFKSGAAYAARGDYYRAIAAYGRAMELNPEFAEAYLERGLFYKSSGHTGEAVKDLERFLAISKDPGQRKLVEEELRKLR